MEVITECQNPGTRVTGSYELPCGCQKLKLGPLEEHTVVLSPESTFQSLSLLLNIQNSFRGKRK